jgi:hypothetical protein
MAILKSSDDSNATTTDQYISTILHILFFSTHSFRFSIFQFPFCCRSLSVEQRFEIIRSIGEECIQDDELRNLLANKPDIVCYDGFEPSGRMHIAQVINPLFF